MEITVEPLPRRGRVARVLVNVACVAVTLVAIGFLLPAVFGLERYVIAGGSMTGSIGRGSVVFEEVVPVSDLAVGDVITYLPPADSSIENLVTHRIVSIDGDTFRTKGDANASADPWTFRLTGPSQARVVQQVPYVGYALIALQDRGTRMAVIGVPAALVALFSLRELVVALRRRPGATDVPVEGNLSMATEPAPLRIPVQADAAQAGAPRARSRRPHGAPEPARSSDSAQARTR